MKQQIKFRYYKNSIQLLETFSSFLLEVMHCECLEKLHQSNMLCSSSLKRGTDQSTAAHIAVYKEFDQGLDSKLVQSYRSLCAEWISELSNNFGIESWAIQRYPSLRVQLPSNISVFEFHRDSDYQHPFGEINHFLSLTRAEDSSALHVEEHLGWNDFKPLNLQPAQSAIINTSVFRHGDYINSQGYTRVSIDFRAIPKDVLDKHKNLKSITKSRKFDCSDYFIDSNKIFLE
jgi:hypothetical protein